MLAELWPQISAALRGYLRGANWRELLISGADILIVYYVIYRVLRLIRGTRAAQMLVGMGLVAMVYVAAKSLQLTTVSWLFENLLNYVIIFMIVIFQHDIRRGLMQVGQNLYRRRQYEESYVIEEVVQAADHLSRHRIGGLIVLEREADLADYLGEAGVELDARVTKELLVTLFIPDAENHMHDGALIIKNLRVQQAGAVLPLSANARLDKQLGTRHRAAIGITEETDAVVVVVSEERGVISLCFNGNIASGLQPATLRKALLSLFQKKPKQKPKPEPFFSLPRWWPFRKRAPRPDSPTPAGGTSVRASAGGGSVTASSPGVARSQPGAATSTSATNIAAPSATSTSATNIAAPSATSTSAPSATSAAAAAVEAKVSAARPAAPRELPPEVLSLVVTQPMARPRPSSTPAVAAVREDSAPPKMEVPVSPRVTDAAGPSPAATPQSEPARGAAAER